MDNEVRRIQKDTVNNMTVFMKAVCKALNISFLRG